MNHPFSLSPRAVVVTACLTLAGCSVPTDDGAQAVDDIPEEVFAELPTTTTTTPVLDEDVVNVRFYFHDEDGVLVRVFRPFDEAPALGDTLTQLLEGPRQDETSPTGRFIQATMNPTLAPQVTDISDGVAYLTVSDEPGFREAANRRLAAAELVCTAVQYVLVDAVVISDSQGTIPLTDLDAETIDGPARAVHYEDCEPPLPLPDASEG